MAPYFSEMHEHFDHRILLQQQQEFDILNQHSWDFYDWCFLSFALLFCGAMCFCFGCWSYKKLYIADPDDIEEEDVQEFSTPISPSANKTKKYAFAGFNIFGEKLEVRNRIARHQQMASSTNNTPYSSSTSVIPITPNQSIPSQVSRHSSLASDNEYIAPTNTNNMVLQTINTQIKHVPQVPPMIMMPNPDVTQQSAIPNIAVPRKDSAIIPKYNVDGLIATPQTVMSPDSAEESQTHLSIEISTTATSVPAMEPLKIIDENISVQFDEHQDVTPFPGCNDHDEHDQIVPNCDENQDNC